MFIDDSFDTQRLVLGCVRSPNRYSIEEVVALTRTDLRREGRNRKRPYKIHEFSDYELHHSYPRIKRMLLDRLANYYYSKNLYTRRRDVEILSVWAARNKALSERYVYVVLLLRLLSVACGPLEGFPLPRSCTVVVDMYGDRVFRTRLIDRVREAFPEMSLRFDLSAKVKGLQVADLVTGTIRRALGGEDLSSYAIIEPIVRHSQEVKL
ncbi:MAG: DUF3800 domain-containing protein [Desulfotomaculales bacterium]